MMEHCGKLEDKGDNEHELPEGLVPESMKNINGASRHFKHLLMKDVTKKKEKEALVLKLAAANPFYYYLRSKVTNPLCLYP